MFETMMAVFCEAFYEWNTNVDLEGPWQAFKCPHGHSIFCDELCFRVLYPEKKEWL